MKASGCHTPATVPQERTPEPIKIKDREGMDGYEGGNLSPLPGFEHRTVLPVASRYTDWATPAPAVEGIPYFFFHWHYSPLWALACRTMSFHFFLSATTSLHLLTPSTWRSLSTSSFHPFLGLRPSSRPFQFLSEDLSGHPILLHSL